MTSLKSLTHFSGYWLEWCAKVLRSKYGVLWCDVPRSTLLLLGVILQKWCTSHLVCKAHHNFYSEVTLLLHVSVLPRIFLRNSGGGMH